MTIRFYYNSFSGLTQVCERLFQSDTTSALVSGKIYPSGAFTVGIRPRARELKADSNYEVNRGRFTFYRRCHWHYQEGLVVETLVRTNKSETLGLSNVSNCHNQSPVKHGLKGITRSGSRKVRECANLLEERFTVKRLGFYTLTCPYSDEWDIWAFNENISEIQRRYFQEVKREYERKGCSWAYVSTIEIQTDRYAKSGCPALHIHYLAPCYVPGEWSFVLTADEIRDIWRRACTAVVGGQPQVSSSVDSQVVKSSAIGYIAKYLSKGGDIVETVGFYSPTQLPSQWWSTSRNLRLALSMLTVAVSQWFGEYLIYVSQDVYQKDGVIAYRGEINVTINGVDKIVGVAGQLSLEVRKKLFDKLSIHQVLADCGIT